MEEFQKELDEQTSEALNIMQMNFDDKPVDKEKLKAAKKVISTYNFALNADRIIKTPEFALKIMHSILNGEPNAPISPVDSFLNKAAQKYLTNDLKKQNAQNKSVRVILNSAKKGIINREEARRLLRKAGFIRSVK
jgi:hypothetical protein